METKNVLCGLSTINFYASDIEAAKKWYSDFLGIEPYFSVPGYAEFRIGDYQQELGIIDSRFAPKSALKEPACVIAYWHVDNLQATFEKLIRMGATVYEPIVDRGQGKGKFVTASVVDPFGNILGIMTNIHFVEMHQKQIE